MLLAFDGVTTSDVVAIFIAFTTIAGAGLLTFFAWMAKQIVKHGEIMAQIGQEMRDHDERIAALDARLRGGGL